MWCVNSRALATHRADIRQERVKKALEPILGVVPAYTSADQAFYSKFSIANPPPTSVLLAFSNSESKPVGSLPFPVNQKDLERFIQVHRHPTVTHLTSGNYNEVMKTDSRAIVVLAALHKGDDGEKERQKLMSVAKAWKRGGRGFVQPVLFAWIEGERWSSWLRQSYGIKKKNLPAVVVVDPAVRRQILFGVTS
jgi:hypothetical protein